MSTPRIVVVPLSPTRRGHRPLLLLGPSLGTAVGRLWGTCAQQLTDRADVAGWELPGHGQGEPWDEPFTVAELAAGVARAVDRESFVYAGDSLGAAVGLQLLVDQPNRVAAAALIATGAVIGTPAAWQERAALVRQSGTDAMVAGSRQRWFAPGFADRNPATAAALLDDLRAVHDASYARSCEALAGLDLRPRLAEISVPVLAIAGAHDQVTTTASLAEIADGVPHGHLEVVADAAHLPPAETPVLIAALIQPLISVSSEP